MIEMLKFNFISLNIMACIACTIACVLMVIKGYVGIAVMEGMFALFNIPFIVIWLKDRYGRKKGVGD